jgi:hypothetical protein
MESKIAITQRLAVYSVVRLAAIWPVALPRLGQLALVAIAPFRVLSRKNTDRDAQGKSHACLSLAINAPSQPCFSKN